MDSTTVVMKTMDIAEVSNIDNIKELVGNMNAYTSIAVPIISLLCVGYVFYKIVNNSRKQKISIVRELQSNAVDYMELFMIMSSVAAMCLFTASSVIRGTSGIESLLRFMVLSFMEITFYMVSSGELSKALSDGVFTKKEILLNLILFGIALFFTCIMNLFYYEATGALSMVYQPGNFFIDVQFVSNSGIKLEFSNLILIWSTPAFAVITNFINHSSQGGASNNNFRSSRNQSGGNNSKGGNSNKENSNTSNNSSSRFNRLKGKLPKNLMPSS